MKTRNLQNHMIKSVDAQKTLGPAESLYMQNL